MGNRTTEAKRPPTLDHLPPKQPRREVVPVLMSEDAAHALEAAQVALFVASEADRPGAQAAVDAAQAAVREATVDFVFAGIGRPAYEALAGQHPPTDEQMAAHAEAVAAEAAKPIGERQPVTPPLTNEATFAPALIAASCVSHSFTAEEATAYFDSPEWNGAEVSRLYTAAVEVNATYRRVSAGKGSGSTRG